MPLTFHGRAVRAAAHPSPMPGCSRNHPAAMVSRLKIHSGTKDGWASQSGPASATKITP